MLSMNVYKFCKHFDFKIWECDVQGAWSKQLEGLSCHHMRYAVGEAVFWVGGECAFKRSSFGWMNTFYKQLYCIVIGIQ